MLLDPMTFSGVQFALALGVILLIAYIGVSLVRLQRIRHKRSPASVSELQTLSAGYRANALSSYRNFVDDPNGGDLGDPSVNASDTPQEAPIIPSDGESGDRMVVNSGTVAPDSGGHDAFDYSLIEASHVLLNSVLDEVQSLHAEIVMLRSELGALRTSVTELTMETSATNIPISPRYVEALDLSVRGIDPASISAECGISRAEAELVNALSKGESLLADNHLV